MKIKSDVDLKSISVGVIIGRFQVNKLHDGHRELINYVLNNHKEVIIMLGVPRMQNTKRNPLPFAARKAMLQKEFKTVNIVPILDQRSNAKWSYEVDSIIPNVYGDKSAVIYGSRDSFIPYYSGKYPVVELEESNPYNGTNIREEVARETLDSDDFRSGIIYSSYGQKASTDPTVDIVVHDYEGKILLCRKPDESQFRFFGGKVERTDKSYEAAALRELKEESGGSLEVGKPKYITSMSINDWRYKSEDSGIMTTLFLTGRNFGMARATDDLTGGEVKWFDVNYFSNYHGIRTSIVPEHRDLMTAFITKVYDEKLIPKIGDKLEEVTNITYLNN